MKIENFVKTLSKFLNILVVKCSKSLGFEIIEKTLKENLTDVRRNF